MAADSTRAVFRTTASSGNEPAHDAAMPLHAPAPANPPHSGAPSEGAAGRLPPAPSPDEPTAPVIHLPVAPLALGGGSAEGRASTGVVEEATVISRQPPLPLGPMPTPTLPQLLGQTLVGTRLDHYELNEFVGGGGMGAVFRATDTRLGRTVAVKVLSRDHSDEETLRRFRNEAQSAARLDHPNIARVYDVGEDRGWNFIVFEFIEGVNLRDRVQSAGPLELEEALLYVLQVAEALEHASSRDVVHRDIKPSNVLVTASGQVKLVDMGLARLHQVEAPAGDITASGVTLGTFDYISPEQARDPRLADVRSDIYSLGCTLFYMLTGQPPFPEGTALQKLLRHNSDDPPDVRQFRPELPPQVSALIRKMLAKRPAQRHQSAAELIAELIVLGQQLDLPRLAQRGQLWVPIPVAVPWWRQAPIQVLAAAGTLAILILLHEWLLAPEPKGIGGEAPGPLRLVPANVSGTEEPASATAPALPEEAAFPSPPLSAAPPAAVRDAARSPPRSEPESAPEGTPGLRPPRATVSDDLVPETPPRPHPTDSSPAAPGEAGIVSALLPAEPAEVPPRPRRLVVSALPQPPEPASEQVRSLDEALAKAVEWSIGEIELRVDGPLPSPPIEVALPRLTVRAAAGFRPVVHFQPTVDAPERVMLRLTGGNTHLTLEGVELRLDLPDDAPADGWALLGVSTGQSLELTDTVLTIDNGPRPQQPLHDQVAMVSVQRRRPLDGMGTMDPLLAMGQQARLALNRVFARGEASFLHLAEETPLTLSWNQGLLVCGQHLVQTSGSMASPKYYDQIVIDLTHVTAYCRQGLYYLRRGPGKGHQFRVNFYARECIFLTEPDRPLFEMVGVPALPEEDELVSIGEGNRYAPQDVVFLRLHSGLPGDTVQDFELGKRWSTETRSQAGVLWQRPPPLHQPLHTLSKDDFWVDASLGRAGCDVQVLPAAWSDVVSPPAPAASPTSPLTPSASPPSPPTPSAVSPSPLPASPSAPAP